jgi:hypothetical protein
MKIPRHAIDNKVLRTSAKGQVTIGGITPGVNRYEN